MIQRRKVLQECHVVEEERHTDRVAAKKGRTRPIRRASGVRHVPFTSSRKRARPQVMDIPPTPAPADNTTITAGRQNRAPRPPATHRQYPRQAATKTLHLHKLLSQRRQHPSTKRASKRAEQPADKTQTQTRPTARGTIAFHQDKQQSTKNVKSLSRR